MKIKAAVLKGTHAEFEIEELELQEPKDEEILVRILAAGICHTDSSVRDGIFDIGLPAVLGHEGAGIVVSTGKRVRGIKQGDHVVLTYGTCGTCEKCRKQMPYACENLVKINFGGKMKDGTSRLLRRGRETAQFFAQSSFAEYAVVHQNSAVVVDSEIEFPVLAPMGCGIQTGAGIVLNQLRPEPGSSLTVFGCGTVGMSAIMAAKLAGCGIILAVGGNEDSLKLALDVGATHVINRRKTDDVAEQIRRVTGGGSSFVIDTTGYPPMTKTALLSASYSGHVAFAANCVIEVNTGSEMANRTVYGVSEGNAVPGLFIPKLLSAYRQGHFPIDCLIKTYPFEEINRAFEDSERGKAIKAVLIME